MKFVVEIELGNDAMRTGDDVADALKKIAKHVAQYDDIECGIYSDIENRKVYDVNGNKVGTYGQVDD
jgi:hypothetical protein